MKNYGQIKTIKSLRETKYKEKGSLFIGKVFPISSAEECEKTLAGIKKEYYDATHHCYAYKLTGGTLKYSDDGEPNGTAGIRILNAIEHFELSGVMSVVIRYFGGVKLGVGPLGKAYYYSAFQTLEAADIVIKRPYKKISITVDFNLLSRVHRILSDYKAIIDKTSYDSNVNFIFFAEIESIDSIEKELVGISKGGINFTKPEDVEYL